jgi:hypothetical protein
MRARKDHVSYNDDLDAKDMVGPVNNFLHSFSLSGRVAKRLSDYEFDEYLCIQGIHQNAVELWTRGKIVAIDVPPVLQKRNQQNGQTESSGGKRSS